MTNNEELLLMVEKFNSEGEGRARPAILIGLKDMISHREGFSGEMVVICSGGLSDPLAVVDLLQSALDLAKTSIPNYKSSDHVN